MKDYAPRVGSVPAQMIALLQTQGSPISNAAAAHSLGVAPKNLLPSLLAAINHGLLVKVPGTGYALPGTTDATDATDTTDTGGGAAKPAFPGAPPRAADPPSRAPRKMRTLKQVAKAFHRDQNKLPVPGLATVPAPEPASLRQIGGTHYKQMPVQPWDVVDGWPLEQRIGYYRGNALKYLMRMGSKDQDAQEIGKGRHYIEKLLEVLQEQDVQVAA